MEEEGIQKDTESKGTVRISCKQVSNSMSMTLNA